MDPEGTRGDPKTDGLEQDTARRGELRIYLGAAPGVGKTFAMLGEAHRRRERGTDVVEQCCSCRCTPNVSAIRPSIPRSSIC